MGPAPARTGAGGQVSVTQRHLFGVVCYRFAAVDAAESIARAVRWRLRDAEPVVVERFRRLEPGLRLGGSPDSREVADRALISQTRIV